MYLTVELLDHVVNLCLLFEEMSDCFPLAIFPPLRQDGSLPPHAPSTCYFLFVVCNSHPKVCVVMSHCGFDLYFPNDY